MPQQSKSGWIAIVGGVVIVFVLIVLHSFMDEQPSLNIQNYVSIGVENNALSALVVIAKQQGFFKKRGLKVKLITYPSSHDAMHALLHHRVDIVTATNIPILVGAFKQGQFSIVATLNEAPSLSEVVVRKGRGIESPTDLIGKRIATVLGSGGEYYAHLFLRHYNIPSSSVQFVYMPASKLVLALRSGYVDAFVFDEPYTSDAQLYMPGQIRYFKLPNLYRVHFNLVVMNTGIAAHFDKVTLVLQGLMEALQFTQQHQQVAQNDVIAFLGESRRTQILAAWPYYNFMVDLPNGLLASLKTEAGWVVSSGEGVSTQQPDFAKLIDSRPLEAAKTAFKVVPSSVNEVTIVK